MSLFSNMYPDEYFDSAYDIDYKKMYDNGYRGVIFDIDNTLVPQDAPADERSISLLNELRRIGFKVMILSNNKQPRVKKFAEAFDFHLDNICRAGKPSRKGYNRAMEHMGTTKENTFFVGDQLFTDIWGANRSGMHSILVKPMDPREEIQIVMKRKIEKIFLRKIETNKRG